MSFEADGVISLNQSSITGQTFHWHDELELLFIVEGSLDLKVGYEHFLLKKGDIMLINSDEIHSMRKTEENNIVVCTYIDCNFIYEKYPDFYEIVAFWPYSEAFLKLNQNKIEILRHINNIASSLERGYADNKIITLIYSLLKSLVYCYRVDITNPEGVSFQVTDEKMDVIYRTIKYLYSNYNHKVNLQEISEQEYLSMFYLSHSFKDITGYSFRDWLNFVRVEKAEKMLLDTTVSITDIAYRCGFSDVRYFNKHFVKWYKISPSKYRKLFRESYVLHDSMESFEESVTMSDISKKIQSLAPERKSLRLERKNVDLDLCSSVVLGRISPSWKEELWCSGFKLVSSRQRKQVSDVQQYMNFTAITVDEMFSLEGKEINNIEFYNLLNYLLDKFSKIYLIINCEETDQFEIDTVEEVMQDFCNLYDRSKTAQIEFRLNLIDDTFIIRERTNKLITLFDSLNIGYKKYNGYKKPVDRSSTSKNDRFANMIEGDLRLEWLFSKEGFKNNLYYFYFFMVQMGEAVVAKESSFIITRKRDDFQVFFHNEGVRTNDVNDLKYELRFKNIEGNYKFIMYTWDMKCNDFKSVIKNKNVIKHMSDLEYDLVDKASMPMVSIEYIDEHNITDGIYELELTLAPTSMYLINFTKI